MRATVGLLLAVLAGCYDPQLERCAVRCSFVGDPCPLSMTCGTDNHCHTADDMQECPVDSFTITVDPAGTGDGIVTGMPDLNCPPTCDETVVDGTDVALSAIANAGSRFVSWGGACSGSDASCSVTVTNDVTVGANFNLTEAITVELMGTGGGDVVSIQPVDLALDCNLGNAPCTVNWDEGASITLSTEPDSQSVFDGWGGDCAAASGNTCTLVLSGPVTAIALFD